MDTFLVSKVYYLKTKRTFGHGVLIGTGVGVGIGTIGLAIVAVADSNSDDEWAGFGVAVGSLAAPYIGALAGTVVGAVTKEKHLK